MCRPMKLIVNSFSPGRITMKKEARKITSPILKRLNGNEDYFFRYQRIKEISTKVRVSEYLITNACNIRCKGCWFFEYGFEKQTKDVNDLEKLRTFLRSERDRGINTSLIIGGEPTLHPKRLGVFGGGHSVQQHFNERTQATFTHRLSRFFGPYFTFWRWFSGR